MLQFDPFSPAVDADPFPIYKRLRDEAPCFWSEEAQMWVLSRYADIVTALNDWRTYSSASGNMMTELPNRAGATLGTTDPPRHDRLRALVQYAFTKRGLEAWRADARGRARRRRRSARRNELDFKDFSAKFTVRTLIAALGLPTGDEAIVDEDTVREKAVLMVQSDPSRAPRGPSTSPPSTGCRTMRQRSSRCAARNPKNDLISNFASAEIDGDRLDEREVLLTTTTLIMAGVESLGGFMMSSLYNLVELPEARGGSGGPRAAAATRSRKACASIPRPSASAAA